MKPIIFVCFFLACCLAAFAQTGKITGLVMDAETKIPLELATVSVFRADSSLITYQLSSKEGKFTFDKLPLKQKLLLSVTYSGYAAFQTSRQLESAKADTLTVFLNLHQKDTHAIVITIKVPISMNGDTLEINPAAFRMKQDAVVEELLNQVSGITIWSDGTITVNGKKVQNLLVDGKPFMGSNDSRVATQNLPKTAIDKIQLYQEYDRSQIGQQTQPKDSLLTMNIKLKEDSKKGYFGKAGAGYGTTERFESDLSFQFYNKSTSAGIGGGINNINKNIGNIQEMFQNNTYRNYNPNLYSVGRFGNDGINKNYSIGGVFSHSFIESANSRQNNRLAVNYNTSGTDAFISDLSLQNRTTINNPQQIREEGVQNNRSSRHDVGINYVKTNSYSDNMDINGSFNSSSGKTESNRFTEVRDSAQSLQSTNAITTVENRWANNASLSMQFSTSDYEDPLKNFSVRVNANSGNSSSERDMQSRFLSYIDQSKNTSYNRRYNSAEESVGLTANLDYSGFKRFLLGRYNFFGINLGFNNLVTYNRVAARVNVSDFDSINKIFVANGSISNSNRREVFEYSPSLSLSKNFSAWSQRFHRSLYVQFKLVQDLKTEKNQSSFAKRNLDRSFQFLRYEANMGYNYTREEKYQSNFSVNYSKSFDYPSVDQLYTIIDDINAYEIRVGNPALRNWVNHRGSFNGNFYTQNSKSPYSINGFINGSYTLAVNPVTDSLINDPSGKRVSYFTNADNSKQVNIGYGLNVSRRFNKNSLQLMYNGSYGTGKTPLYVDGVYSLSQTGNLFNQVSLQFSLQSLLIVTAGQNFQHARTRQTAAGLSSFKNDNNTTKLGVVLNYPTNFTFSSTLDRIKNSNLQEQTVLWNAFATYRFLKQQGELKFSAMDLLKQYRNISNFANAYGTTTRISNGLQQYFLLTFSYYPRKFGKTELKKQSAK
ncbi:MAG TPA: carboxypeptidase regulatory-like domain-containing protein [Flavisolibacter sp.]|nr:carboxypeptidase regulatory-like domain-containing protein [Flavisolibacter sp.]